jgi:hypothetical protein
MTAEQLLRLAHLAEEAADYAQATHPALAYRLIAAAGAARTLAEIEAEGEQQAHMYTLLEEIKAAVA